MLQKQGALSPVGDNTPHNRCIITEFGAHPPFLGAYSPRKGARFRLGAQTPVFGAPTPVDRYYYYYYNDHIG